MMHATDKGEPIILSHPNNSVSIYNRWEEKVYEIIGYQNDWRGIGNISSNSIDLPDGVYYYILDLGNGSPLIKGFIYIFI